MTANEAKIIEFMTGTGPLTHGESAALIELFHEKSYRLDAHTKSEIGQAMRQSYQERVSQLRELSLMLENAASAFADETPRMSAAQRDLYTTLVKHIERITDYIDERM